MKISKIKPSREFEVGISPIKLKHTADIELDDNEMVTFRNKNNLEYVLRIITANSCIYCCSSRFIPYYVEK